MKQSMELKKGTENNLKKGTKITNRGYENGAPVSKICVFFNSFVLYLVILKTMNGFSLGSVDEIKILYFVYG